MVEGILLTLGIIVLISSRFCYVLCNTFLDEEDKILLMSFGITFDIGGTGMIVESLLHYFKLI